MGQPDRHHFSPLADRPTTYCPLDELVRHGRMLVRRTIPYKHDMETAVAGSREGSTASTRHSARHSQSTNFDPADISTHRGPATDTGHTHTA